MITTKRWKMNKRAIELRYSQQNTTVMTAKSRQVWKWQWNWIKYFLISPLLLRTLPSRYNSKHVEQSQSSSCTIEKIPNFTLSTMISDKCKKDWKLERFGIVNLKKFVNFRMVWIRQILCHWPVLWIQFSKIVFTIKVLFNNLRFVLFWAIMLRKVRRDCNSNYQSFKFDRRKV